MIDTTSYHFNHEGESKNKKTAVFFGVIVLIIALVGGIFMLRQPKKMDETKVAVVENKEPSPTEKPKIDKNSVKAQILNGTGIAGQAGIVVEALKKAGYNAENIKTANAKDFNNTTTTIAVKDGFDNVTSDLKDALQTTFDEIKIDSTHLDKSSEFDIVITTGGKKIETTPTLTPSPTSKPTPTP